MRASHEVSHQGVQWVRQRWRREFDVRARDELLLPLFLVEVSSFALLILSPVVKLARATLFLLAGMFVIFAVWAVFGFAYPSAPLPIALNVISKILAFATAVSLFLSPEKSAWFVRQVVPARQEIDQLGSVQSKQPQN